MATASCSSPSSAASCCRSAAALTDQHLDRLKHKLAGALAHARTCGQLTFDPDARERYSSIYEQLSAPQPGMFGAATGRAEAHTIRLALIYAPLDSSADDRAATPRGRARRLALRPRLDPLGIRR